MDYNYNYFDYNLNPYFTPNLFQFRYYHIILTNQVCQIGLIRSNICLNSQYYEQEWDNHPHSSPSQWGYNSPESYYQHSYKQTTSYTPYQDEPIEEKSSLQKTFETFLEFTRQVQIITDSILPNNFQIQDLYSNFQVQP